MKLLDLLLGRRNPATEEQGPHPLRWTYVLPGDFRVTIKALTAQEALGIIKQKYGTRASREAWLIGTEGTDHEA